MSGLKKLVLPEGFPYAYETHLHTSPVSRCAKATVRESLEFYKSLGYDGVFITNHFIDGNINADRSLPFRDRIEFFYSDAEEGERLAEEIGITVISSPLTTYTACGELYVHGLPGTKRKTGVTEGV